MSIAYAAVALVIAAAHAVASSAGEPEPQALSGTLPRHYSIAAGIDWAIAREVGGTTFVLIATAEGGLECADPRWPTTDPAALRVKTGAGLRLASDSAAGARSGVHTSSTAYCFDRYSVYAVAMEGSGDARLAWQRGDWPEGVAANGDTRVTFQGDPEALSAIVAAVAVPDGVVVVRNDGSLALLDRLNGAPRWKIKLEPLTVAELAAHGREVVLLCKRGREARAVFLHAGVEEPNPAAFTVAETWPIWWRACPGGLVAVWPSEAVIVRTNGSRAVAPAAPLLTRFSAALLGLDLPQSDELSRAADPSTQRESLLIAADEAGAVAAYALSDARPRWHQAESPFPPPMLTIAPQSLHVCEAHALVIDSSLFGVYACADGTTLGGAVAAGPIRAVTLSADRIRILYTSSFPLFCRGFAAALWLRSEAVSKSEGLDPRSRPGPPRLLPMSADQLRSTQWLTREVLIVARREAFLLAAE